MSDKEDIIKIEALREKYGKPKTVGALFNRCTEEEAGEVFELLIEAALRLREEGENDR